jgi:hypothetical protein
MSAAQPNGLRLAELLDSGAVDLWETSPLTTRLRAEIADELRQLVQLNRILQHGFQTVQPQMLAKTDEGHIAAYSPAAGLTLLHGTTGEAVTVPVGLVALVTLGSALVAFGAEGVEGVCHD